MTYYGLLRKAGVKQRGQFNSKVNRGLSSGRDYPRSFGLRKLLRLDITEMINGGLIVKTTMKKVTERWRLQHGKAERGNFLRPDVAGLTSFARHIRFQFLGNSVHSGVNSCHSESMA